MAEIFPMKQSDEEEMRLWQLPVPIGDDEWRTARLTPRCIVESYVYADVGLIVAPGSTGKTTFTLYEMAHIVLGRRLLGLKVYTPGPCILISGEDRREFLVGRLREVCAALGLSAADEARVRELVRIDDRTRDVAKLALVVDDVVVAAPFADAIAKSAKDFAPVLVQFDPLISFGVGEARVNDAMQGLVEAARVITGELDCCTRYTHHTGQQAARDKIVDQYSGRSGTALADGCRMVAVLVALNDLEVFNATGEHLTGKQSAFALHRPKLSYAPPEREPLYVRRDGYGYELLPAVTAPTGDARAKILGDQLARFIESELREGRRYTRRDLDDRRPGELARADVRTGLAWLTASGQLFDQPITDPETGKAPAHGARSHLVIRRIDGAATP